MSDEPVDSQENCPKCRSHRWMTGLPISAGGGPLGTHVAVDFWVGTVGVSKFQVSICADCGFSELYATDPGAVWVEWRKKNT